MPLTNTQTIIMIIAIASGTIITRFLPFILFPEKKEPPKIIVYLGRVLPASMMGLLVVYCMRNVSIIEGSHGLPELLAMTLIVILHKWKGNVLLSISAGTALYMFLVQVIFT